MEGKLSETPRPSGGNVHRRRAWSGGGMGLLLAIAVAAIALGAWFLATGLSRHGSDDAAGAVKMDEEEDTHNPMYASD